MRARLCIIIILKRNIGINGLCTGIIKRKMSLSGIVVIRNYQIFFMRSSASLRTGELGQDIKTN